MGLDQSRGGDGGERSNRRTREKRRCMDNPLVQLSACRREESVKSEKQEKPCIVNCSRKLREGPEISGIGVVGSKDQERRLVLSWVSSKKIGSPPNGEKKVDQLVILVSKITD